MIKAFVFDIDDTIYDQQKAFRRAFERQFNNLIDEIDTVNLYRLVRAFGDETFSTGYDKTNLRKTQVHRIKRALWEYEIAISEVEALGFQEHFERYQEDIDLFSEIPQLFESLVANEMGLGIITNGTNKRQSKKIEHLGLEKWIPAEHMLISQEVGIAKPSKDIFRQMEFKLSLSASDIIYIGDNYQNDIVGAKSAGWQAVWANYRGFVMTDVGLNPEYTVSSPEELAVVIRGLVKNE